MLTPTTALLALALSGPATVMTGAETGVPAIHAPAAEPNFGAIVADRSPAMANVKFVLSVEYGGQSQEFESEAMALMIDTKGLLVLSASEIAGRKGMSVTPKDIKVLLGDDTEGVSAKLIGRDSELDLAWLRIEKPADKGYSAFDTSKGATPKIGDTLVGLDRMGKYFDHTPVAMTTTIGGITKKPRTLYIPSGGLVLGVGLPFFTTTGEFVGISAVQQPNADSEDDVSSRTHERMSYFDRGLKILPASEILSATARALEAEKSGKGVGMDEPKKDADPAASPAGDKKDEPKGDAPKKEEPKKKD